MKKIKFYIIINGTLIIVTGLRTFTLQGEKFIIHRATGTEGLKNKRCWCISHFNTGLGTGILEDTQDEALHLFKAKVKRHKANIRDAVKNKVQINNKKKLFPCLKCQQFRLSKDTVVSLCGHSKKQPHERKKICKKFIERSCIK